MTMGQQKHIFCCTGHDSSNSKGSQQDSAAAAAHVAAAEIHCGSGVSTYNCPVCRKAQILDLDRLQVSLLLLLLPIAT